MNASIKLTLALALVGLGLRFANAADAFVESSGAQAINTGYHVKSNTKLVVDFQVTDASKRSAAVFGTTGGSGTTCLLWVNGSTPGNLEPNFGDWCGGILSPADTSRYTIEYDLPGRSVKIYSHGSSTPLNTKGADKVQDLGTSDRPLALFANCKSAGGSNVENCGYSRIYSFKVFEGGALVHDWVPAMKAGEVGFVDKVGGGFIRMHLMGVAPLTIGGDYETLDDDPFIQSDGATIVNTGFRPGPDMKMEIDFACTDAAQDQRVFGATVDGGQSFEYYANTSGGFSWIASRTWTGGIGINARDTVRRSFVIDIPNDSVALMTGNTATYTAVLSATSSDVFTEACEAPVGLFGRCIDANGCADWAGGRSTARIYGVKFWKNGTLVKNLVPCVKGGVPGFRDAVDGAFHTGENVAALTAGGNVGRIVDDGFVETVGNDIAAGGHFIDTGYTAGVGTRVEADYAFAENYGAAATGDWWVLNSNFGDNVELFGLCANQDTLNASLGATHRWANTGLPNAKQGKNIRRTLVLDSPGKTIAIITAGYTNYVATVSAGLSQNMGQTLKLASTAGGGGGYAPVKFYRLKIYENNTLVRDYKPYVSNGAPGLKYGGTFVKFSWNANNGAAGMPTAGGDIDVSSASDRDAYALFSGAQSIDTGYKANGNTKFVVDFAFANGFNKPQQFVFETGSEIIGRIYTSGSGGTGAGYSWTYSKGGNWTGTGVAVDHQRRLFTVDAYGNQVRMTPGGYTGDATMAGLDNDYQCTQNTRIGSNVAGSSSFSRIRLYRFSIYEAGEKVREFVPCMDGAVPCLHDLVGGGTYTTAGLQVVGRGHQGAQEWIVRPADVSLAESAGSVTLRAKALGAVVGYRWTKNGRLIEGGENGSLTVDWSTKPTTDLYAVTPVFLVNDVEVEGEPAVASVTSLPRNFMLIIR
ncbi:MAG: hypothetical protein ACOX9C_06975 [Kiritimatiellia bacterium]|jgi:hypothetical protein